MKAQELRELSLSELNQKLVDFGEELFNLRVQGKTGQLQNNSKITQLKRDIARINTIINEGSYHQLEEPEKNTKKK